MVSSLDFEFNDISPNVGNTFFFVHFLANNCDEEPLNFKFIGLLLNLTDSVMVSSLDFEFNDLSPNSERLSSHIFQLITLMKSI